MTKFLHSGGCGDVIYALPTIKKLGGGILYLKSKNVYNNAVDNYTALKPLLEQLDYISEVRRYPDIDFFNYDSDIKIDFDLDTFRLHPLIGREHMIKIYADSMKIKLDDWSKPWIDIFDVEKRNKSILNLTDRYRTNFKWNEYLKGKEEMAFIGTREEWQKYGSVYKHLKTNSLFDVCKHISNCKTLYCNQSVCLTLAQSMGVDYELEAHPTSMRGCIMRTENETIVNEWNRRAIF